MLTFYEKEGFKLFPCNMDKSPKVASWRATQAHLSIDDADRIMSTNGYIGAWLPKNYIIIDVDMNHTDGNGQPKPDGMAPFIKLCAQCGIDGDLFKSTLVIKTGSGGYHLYFKFPPDVSYSDLSMAGLTTSVDIRTHKGYVIAAGTNGYSVVNDASVAILPAPFVDILKDRVSKKAEVFTPERVLPIELLQKILNKIPADHFNTNDSWQEFIVSVIATSGNSEEVITALEEWSKTDTSYKNDGSVRKRLETFEPAGGISAGTFMHLIKGEDISRYMIDKVRMAIGAQFSVTEGFNEAYKEAPFTVDYSKIHENKELMSAFFYTKHQMAGLTLFANLVKGNLLYVDDEKRFYYYNQSRWVETTGVLNILFIVLLHAGQRFYTDISKKDDIDADECINSYVKEIGSLSLQQKFESALKQHPGIAQKAVNWDGPQLSATLTIKDAVMDFTGKEIVFRPGIREEYRRLFIDLKEEDFKDKSAPLKFKEFLKDVFPNVETRKTATYALSAMVSGTGKFRKFQIWNGSGNNGKSALMDIMTNVIGKERAVPYGSDILLSSKASQSLTPELAVLRGALVAFASETEESKRVSQGMIKKLTGDEEMTANPKYQGMITFKTTFQLVLSTNYLPSFSAHDNAFVNRLLILPFYTCFYDSQEKKEGGERGGSRYFKEAKDINVIKDEIMKEKAKIIYYLATRYKELGISIPESAECTEAKSHYIKDNNGIVDLIHEAIEFDQDMKMGWFTPTNDIVNYYNSDQHTKYSSSFVVRRLKEVLPMVENYSKRVDGKLTRGLKHIRLVYGAYPEGYMGNFTGAEIMSYRKEDGRESNDNVVEMY